MNDAIDNRKLNVITCLNIDIVCPNETFLQPKDNIQVLYSLHLLRLDKIVNRLGGIIILINKNIKFKELVIQNLKITTG